MIIVVLGHVHCPAIKFINAFHMPLFFFLSGVVLSLKPLASFKQYTASRWKRLMIPYLFFELVALLLSLVLCKIQHDPFNIRDSLLDILLVRHDFGEGAHTGFSHRFWFLPCLFFASEMIYPCVRFFGKRKWVIISTIVFFWLLGFICSNYLPGVVPFSADTALVASGFIILGFVFSKTTISFLEARHSVVDALFLLFGIAILLLSVVNNSETVYFYKNSYGSYGLMLLGSFGGILAAIIVSKYLYSLTKFLPSLGKTVNLIGLLSIPIYPAHLFVVYFIEHLHSFHWIILFILTLAVSVPLSGAIKKFTPAIIGEKKSSGLRFV
jgi:fucose 4-O-acetylase-like acetyltransferase